VWTFDWAYAVPCDASVDNTTIGSHCHVSTTANSVVPGSVAKGKKAIWEIGDVQVYDGGSDGVSSTTNDNPLFEVHGLFVP
jgi:acetyltransferase-like isoleucine patch superfamily enzyme